MKVKIKITEEKPGKGKVEGIAHLSEKEFEELTGENPIDVLGSGIEDYGICDDCGELLPAPICENREGNYFEDVTYCKCGAVYTD